MLTSRTVGGGTALTNSPGTVAGAAPSQFLLSDRGSVVGRVLEQGALQQSPGIREFLSGVDPAPTGGLTLVTGSGTAVGDLLVCIHGIDWYDSAGMTTPTGTAGTWTQQAFADCGTNAPKVKVWTRKVTVAGVQTVTVPNVSDAGLFHFLYVVKDAAEVDSASQQISVTQVGSAQAPSLTTSGQYRLLICAWLSDSSGPVEMTPPGSMTEMSELDAGQFSTMSTATEVVQSQGATGTRSATLSANRAFAAVAIAVHAVPAPVSTGSVGLDAVATLTTVEHVAAAASLTLPGVTAFTARQIAVRRAAVTLSAMGTATAAPSVVAAGAVADAAASGLAAGGSLITTGGAAADAVSGLLVDGMRVGPASAVFSAVTAMQANPSATASGAVLAADTTLTATARLVPVASVSIEADSGMAPTGTRVVSAAAAVTAGSALAGALSSAAVTAAELPAVSGATAVPTAVGTASVSVVAGSSLDAGARAVILLGAGFSAASTLTGVSGQGTVWTAAAGGIAGSTTAGTARAVVVARCVLAVTSGLTTNAAIDDVVITLIVGRPASTWASGAAATSWSAGKAGSTHAAGPAHSTWTTGKAGAP